MNEEKVYSETFDQIRERISSENPRIVCLCGSTRFMDKFMETAWTFTLRGYIVLSVGVMKHGGPHAAEAVGEHCAEMLDELHLRKIDMADEVFIINIGGYIGESTKREIDYAIELGKPIQFLEYSTGMEEKS